MPEPVVVLQSELKTREATVPEQEEMDRRIAEDKELFDPEPGAKTKEKGKEDVKKTADQEILEADDDELDDKQKARKAELVKAKEIIEKQEEDDRILEAKDEDLKEAELTRKKELVKDKEGHKTEEEKKAELDKEVKDYATEYSMSEDEARKDLESVSKVQEKYKGDPKQLAKAALHSQRAYDKMKEDLKAVRNAPPPLQSKESTMKMLVEGIESGKYPVNGKPASKDKVVEAYRKLNPELGEDVNDETIVKLVAHKTFMDYEGKRQENLTKLSSEAKEKKAKLIGELSEADKKYLPEIKAMVDGHTDAQIMSDGYDLEDYIFWAKGKDSDVREKEAEERGYKRGVEARKIIGEIKKPADGKSKTKSSIKGGKDFGLTDAQKKEAEEWFSNDPIPLARKYELYADTIPKEKDKKED